MTYAYVIVIYVTYIQIHIYYFQIYYYCLLGHGLPKTCGGSFLYIKILSYFKYYKMSVSGLMNMCIYHAKAKSNTIPLDDKETPSIVFLSFASFSSISL